MIKDIVQAIFLYRSITYDVTLSSLIREQYELAKKGISITESNELPIYEREALVNLVLADKKLETENPFAAMMRKINKLKNHHSIKKGNKMFPFFVY